MFNMKRRNFCKSLIGAAVAAALPASALRDILIHKGNSAGATWSHDGTGFVTHFASPRPYQVEAIRQMELYSQGAARIFPRHAGKTYWLELGNRCHAEIEKRVLAQLAEKPDLIERILNTEQKKA